MDVVLVYKLSRLHRNRYDEANTMMMLQQHDVTLVSATEQIDSTPVGQLMQGILSSFNQYRSAEDGADISYKLGEKAKKGGTVFRAPLGYENVGVRVEDREVRTVQFDKERAPLVTIAFELYASGKYSIPALADELTARGSQPAQRVHVRPVRYPRTSCSVCCRTRTTSAWRDSKTRSTRAGMMPSSAARYSLACKG